MIECLIQMFQLSSPLSWSLLKGGVNEERDFVNLPFSSAEQMTKPLRKLVTGHFDR
jgi:hypothetical protein